MAHSGRSGRRFSSSPKRTTIWNDGPQSTTVQSVVGAGNTIWNLGQTSLGGVTIVRIRGEFCFWQRLATAIGDGFVRAAIGIGIVTTDAFAVGATAMPSPLGDVDWGGWMYYQAFGPIVGESTTEVFRGPMMAVRQQIDTKAMRKIQPNETIFGAFATSVEIGTTQVDFGAMTRMLVKLS